MTRASTDAVDGAAGRSGAGMRVLTGMAGALVLVALAGFIVRLRRDGSGPSPPEEIALQVLWLMCLVLAGGLLGVAVWARRHGAAHRRALEACEESDERFRSMADSAPAMIWMSDSNGRCTYVNKTWTDYTGRTLALELGEGWTELIHPDERDRVVKESREAFGSQRPFRIVYRLRRADGVYRWFLDTGTARYEGATYAGFVGSCLDISEQREVQESIKASERELSDFFNNATIGLRWVGPDGIIRRANRAELEMLGYTSEEYIGHHIAEFHVDRYVIDDILAREARGEVIKNNPARMRCKDGSVRQVVIDSSVLWKDGEFVHTRCFTRDVTAVRQAESEVRELRVALEHAAEGIAKIDPQGRFRSVNPAYAALYGMAPEELVGVDRRSIVHPEDTGALDAAIAEMLGDGKAEVDLRGVRKDGSIFYQRATLVGARGTDGAVNGWYSFIKDVTQRKLSERQLRESFARQNDLFRREKTLLRELNHRVRNNLAGLLGLVGLYERSGKSAGEMGHAIRGKVRAMKEVHDMISHTQGTPVDLGLLVGRMAADRTPEEGSGRIVASGPAVDVPPSQAVALAMVLQELMTNARKYGALSVPGGRVGLAWTYDENAPERVLRLDWTEAGGPPPRPEPVPDVGLNLIEGLAGAELQGRCTFLFEPTGLRFTLEAVLEGGAVAKAVPAA